MLKRAKYRKNVINELINTEKSYIDDLTILVDKVISNYIIDYEINREKIDTPCRWGVKDVYQLARDLKVQLLILTGSPKIIR